MTKHFVGSYLLHSFILVQNTYKNKLTKHRGTWKSFFYRFAFSHWWQSNTKASLFATLKHFIKWNQNLGSFLPDFSFPAEWKKVTSWAKPSWKTFSSSYGSNQLGSDSSLLASFCRIYILSSDSDIYVKKISEMRTSSK